MESSQPPSEPESQPQGEPTAQPVDDATEQPTSERICPNCSAPADAQQRWCLECGAELPQSRRPAMRSAVGIATTLAVLVGAASAGGFTLLQDGKDPPPPAQTQTIAQTPPPAPTTPDTSVPPADDALPTTPDTTPLPGAGRGGGSNGSGGGAGSSVAPPPPPPPPADSSVPDLSDDFDTSSPPPPPPDDDTELDDDGNVREDTGDGGQQRQRRPARPRYVDTNLALSSPAIAYAPYAEGFPDLGDPSLVTDGSTRTVWRSPRQEDPTLQPQMGVYAELASPERIRRLILSTPTPGMSVEIYASRRDNPPSSITDPGWAHLTDRTNVGESSTISLAGTGRWKYVLVWIRSLAPDTDHAEISEIELVGPAPE